MDKSNNFIKLSNVTFWKSQREKDGDPEIQKAKMMEFPEGAEEGFELETKSGLSRRNFIAIAAAGAAFAATACTDYRDKGAIVAYNKKPDNVTPGRPNYYASTCTACPIACGILVKTREGRPIKIDGNPEHPVNMGKICSIGQANVLNLYAPERLQNPTKKQGGSLLLFKDDLVKEDWKVLDKEIIGELKKAVQSGREIAIISRPVTSPTAANMLNDFKAKYPTAKLYTYSTLNDHNRKIAWVSCYLNTRIPSIKWNEADIILSLEGDFLGNEGNFVEQIRMFAQKRNTAKLNEFNRLYTAEAKMSLTGMNADYRFRLKPEYQGEFVQLLIDEIESHLLPIGQKANESSNLKAFAEKYKIPYSTLEQLVKDLLANKGKSYIYAGAVLPVAIHEAVNYLNEILENYKLYDYSRYEIGHEPSSGERDFDALVSGMKSGKVGAVIHFDSNPVFELSSEYGYESALEKVPVVISMTECDNESSLKSNYILPIHHNFESWGDHKVRAGVLSLQQPLINPIYNSRQKEAILLNWCSDKPEDFNHTVYHQYLMNFWEKNVYPQSGAAADFKTYWFASLHNGVVTSKDEAQTHPSFKKEKSTFNIPKQNNSDGYTVLLTNNYTIGADGRYANNGWLQELPHPVTKVAWDNTASISPATAKELNVKLESVIEIKAGKNTFKLPVVVQPGMPDKTVVVELGYGRNAAGDVGNLIGTNVNKLLSKSIAGGMIITGASVTSTGESYPIASTQEHHMLDETGIKDIHKQRHIIQEGTVAEFKKNPGFLKEGGEGEIVSITPNRVYKDVKWAMSIDLNKCVSCGLCVTACNVENNVPFVGKEQVRKGREMQWIRLDRYYSGTNEEPEVSLQPMLCQHCDNAPCENVCPVAATNHSPDGLNQMVYNRCVGTRYCSNNCPFKVRRYNFFDFRDRLADGYQKKDSFALLANPEVTVRSRGVMEKCTFCLQRIMDARQEATRENRKLKGSDVKTACQEACPAEAIVFGDANEHQSAIAEMREHKLGYYVLEELNVKPNVTYVARLRNKITEDK